MAFQIQHVAPVPKGWHVRTVSHKSGHQARIAFPPGPRKKGAGRLVEILHPNRERNPEPGCIEIYELAVGHAGVPEPGSPSAAGISKGISEIAAAPHLVGANGAKGNLAAAGWKSVSGKRVDRSDFAYVGDPALNETWKLPVHDEAHARNALARFAHTSLPRDRRKEVAERIVRAAKKFGIDTSGFEAKHVKNPGKFKYPNEPNPKSKTREQVEKMQEKAVRFLDDVVGDPDKADEIEDMTVEEYADKKRIHLVNPSGFKALAEKAKKAARKIASGVTGKKKNACKNKRPRRNLDEIPDVQKVYETFMGKKTQEITEYDEPDQRRDDFAHTGWLVFLVIQPYSEALEGIADPNDLSEVSREMEEERPELSTLKLWDELSDEFGCTFVVIDFSGGQSVPEQPGFKKYGDGVRVCGAAGSSQLYFIGGNQNIDGLLDKFDVDEGKDFVGLGVLVAYGYLAAKHMPEDPDVNERPTVFQHIMGEEGGDPPFIFYNKLQKRLGLAGGTYSIEAPGITN
jgi:hypothetical protein